MLKKKLAENCPTVGSWLTLAHPAIAEIMAKAGFDWLAVDMEHSVITIREAEELIRVVNLAGVTPLVRLTSNDHNQIKRVMDAGAHGIIVPFVNTPQDVEQAIEALYYPPKGRRGVGLARAQGYGSKFQEYRQWLDQEAVLMIMIENIQALDHLEKMFSYKEVDGYVLGPYDLSSSMGKPGQFHDQDVADVIKHVKDTARKFGKPGGIHIIEPDTAQIEQRLGEGFTFIPYSLDIRMLDVASRQGLACFKEKCK